MAARAEAAGGRWGLAGQIPSQGASRRAPLCLRLSGFGRRRDKTPLVKKDIDPCPSPKFPREEVLALPF